MSEREINAIIEIPQGSLIKYEQDTMDGVLLAERVLNQPAPYNYGYIENTLAGDGDPLDVFVLGDVPLYPLCRVSLEIVGVLKCIDNGEQDDKIIARMRGPMTNWYAGMGIDHIRTYLTTYKDGFVVQGYEPIETALAVIEACKDSYVAETHHRF